MRIARVFPRKTKATPDDELVFFGYPRKGAIPDVDEVHVSIAFTGDIPIGEHLANVWAKKIKLPVKVGGPAYKQPATEFVAGRYLRQGYTITSRGCPNSCSHCDVPKSQPIFIELPIQDGWIVQDDNLLACSESHIRRVFDMLSHQPEHAVLRGLEAARLKPWHVDLVLKINPAELFFAYDDEADYEPLVAAGRMLQEAGYALRKRKLYSYVLMGYPDDTFDAAEKRCKDALRAGFIPFAMLWMDKSGFQDPEWGKFQKAWCRPAAIYSHSKEFFKEAHL